MKHCMAVLSFLSLFLAACSQTSPTPVKITTPTIALTQTRQPTTLPPTSTKTRHVAPTPSRTPTNTIPAATLNARATLEQLTPICKGGYQWVVSPDGQWIADYTCTGDSKSIFFYMKVLNIADGRSWRVNFDNDVLGYFDGSLYPVHWSSSGKYLFVSVTKVLDGPSYTFVNANRVWMLDLSTGEVTEILSEGYHVFSFSEQDQMAYLTDRGINIVNPITRSANLYSIDLNYCLIGDFTWSPSEDKIIYQAIECDKDFNETLYNYFLLNLKDGSVVKVYSSPNRLPLFSGWKGEYPFIKEWDASQNQFGCSEFNFSQDDWVVVECP